MSFIAVAIGAGAVITTGAAIYNGYQQSQAINNASDAQQKQSAAAIAEQQREYDQQQKNFSPYLQAGQGALSSYQDLAGLNGDAAQQAAISALQKGPEYQSLLNAGSNSILQNASATGGLRGGNTQAALGMLGPSVLNSLINNQYSRLSGLTGLGQASAAQQAAAGQNNANAVTGILTNLGNQQAGNYLSQATNQANTINGVLQGYGQLTGALTAYNNLQAPAAVL